MSICDRHRYVLFITIPSTKPVSKAVDLVNRHNLVKFIGGTDNLVIIEGDRSKRINWEEVTVIV